MAARRPSIVVIAGPNGAGKSTAAPSLLQGALGVSEFVNADVIARGLSAFEPERVAMTAGRVMLARIHELARQGSSFAFETTLASRSFAPWIKRLVHAGYRFHLLFLWLPSADMAVARVAERVRAGGHAVPEDVVRRRYHSGLANFFSLYQPMADTWRVYNASAPEPVLIARGRKLRVTTLRQETLWSLVRRSRNGTKRH